MDRFYAAEGGRKQWRQENVCKTAEGIKIFESSVTNRLYEKP